MRDGQETRETSPEPSAATLLAYGAPAFPLAVLTLPFYVLVPAFYAQQMMLPIAAVGQVLLFVRLLDAASDPLTGVLADRFRPRFGRRRLWVACAAPLVAVAAWQVFSPPGDAGVFYLGLWAALLSLAWTGLQIPYGAWGAELSRSYAGRNRVTAYREAFTVAGTLFALAAPAALPLLGRSGETEVLRFFALVVAVGLPVAIAVAVWRVGEPTARVQGRVPLRQGFAAMMANAPFRRLVAAFLLNGFANGLPATLFLFFVQHKLQASEAAGPLLVVYFVCGVLGVPAWLALARRTSKHAAWCWGMLMACAAFAFAPWLGPGDVALFAAVTVVTGLALGADVILPPSIQADVIDVDTAATGEERAGLYLSIWALATKLALALAVGIAYPLLGLAGFDPGRGLATPEGLVTLGLLYAGLPVLLKLGAVALMWRFPLDETAHAKLRATIAARAG